ncbi:MAG: response regulator [Chlorobiaceae bacterium]|nr:response regulator [Chlorobiaceae bacterium]NTW74719.1 response regulator [Chlorobiaceae bacterium]
MKIHDAILVIEDDEDIRQMICEILEEEGYDTLQAANGLEGIEMLRKHQEIGVIVTDLLMPEKEGIETITDIRKDYPRLRILAISGGGICIPESYLSLAKAMGADATLSKPFGTQELLDAIENLIH